MTSKVKKSKSVSKKEAYNLNGKRRLNSDDNRLLQAEFEDIIQKINYFKDGSKGIKDILKGMSSPKIINRSILGTSNHRNKKAGEGNSGNLQDDERVFLEGENDCLVVHSSTTIWGMEQEFTNCNCKETKKALKSIIDTVRGYHHDDFNGKNTIAEVSKRLATQLISGAALDRNHEESSDIIALIEITSYEKTPGEFTKESGRRFTFINEQPFYPNNDGVSERGRESFEDLVSIISESFNKNPQTNINVIYILKMVGKSIYPSQDGKSSNDKAGKRLTSDGYGNPVITGDKYKRGLKNICLVDSCVVPANPYANNSREGEAYRDKGCGDFYWILDTLLEAVEKSEDGNIDECLNALTGEDLIFFIGNVIFGGVWGKGKDA